MLGETLGFPPTDLQLKGVTLMIEPGSRPVMVRSNTDAASGYAILRVTLGLDCLFHSASRWPHVRQFVEKTVGQFAATPLPSWSVHWYSLAILVWEPLVGLLLFIGFRTRDALIAGGLLIATLVFGTALRGDFSVLSEQLIYALIFFVLLHYREESNRWSIDYVTAQHGRRVKT